MPTLSFRCTGVAVSRRILSRSFPIKLLPPLPSSFAAQVKDVKVTYVCNPGGIGEMVSAQFKFLKTSTFWGWFFIVIGSAFFLGFLFAAVISKLLPLSDNPILSAIQNDRYYCFLVPLTLPIIVVAVYFHWLSMKLFKHA